MKSKSQKRKQKQQTNHLNLTSTQKSTVHSTMLPILRKLKSQDGTHEDRAWAATAISNLVLDPDTLIKLMPDVLTELNSSLKTEYNESVLLEVLGALRNTFVAGGCGVCGKYLRSCGLDNLSELLIKFSLQLQQNVPEEERNPKVYIFLEQILACLWSLCEASDTAAEAVTFENMISLLVMLFTANSGASVGTGSTANTEQIPLSLRIVAGQFLNTLSEENEKLFGIFRNGPSVALYKFLSSKNTTEKVSEIDVLAASILYNVRSTLFSSLDEMFALILQVAGKAISFDFSLAFEKVTVAAEQVEKLAEHAAATTTNSKGETLPTNQLVTHQNEYTVYLESVNAELVSLQLAFELLANIFSEEVPEDEVEELEGDDAAMDEDDDFEMEDLINEEEPIEDPQTNTTTRLFTVDLLSSIFEVAAAAVPNTLTSIAAQPFVLNTEKAQIRALACVNNLFLIGAASLISKDHPDMISTFWNAIYDRVLAVSMLEPLPAEYLEALITALWSIARKNVLSPQLLQIEWLYNAASASSNAPEYLQVKIVGILAQFALPQSNINLNKIIGDWMMSQLIATLRIEGPQKADLMSELLNALYDIYSDSHFDYDLPVFVQGGFLRSMYDMIPVVQKKVKFVDKRINRDSRMRCDEALLNLKSFVKYKRSEREQ